MKRSYILYFIFYMLLTTPSLLFTSEALKENLKVRALENISNLEQDKRDALTALLYSYDDLLINFFVASEEPYKLELAEINHILSHYQHVKDHHIQLLDYYSPEFFLAYIAKITVTDEVITPYREKFFQYGIDEILQKYDSIYDRAVALNLWCRQFMTFKPTSGRDLTPLCILKKSNLGRCEEMQIFFISAARSIGIPARPAYTPLWAHTDNNHAWVEVFVNDQWQYLGAVEPDFALNRAWFTGNLNKALLVIAKSSFPDSTDIVLFSSGHTHFINSTPNYTDYKHNKTRKITLRAYNKEQDPEINTEFLINVFNWGMLRPILSLNTGELNEVSIEIGIGSFAVTAVKDSLSGIIHVPSGHKDSLHKVIMTTELENQKYEFIYPDLVTRQDPSDPPQEWNGKVSYYTTKYNKLVESYQNLEIDFTVADSLLQTVWDKFRNNKTVFQNFYEKFQPDRDYLTYLDLIDEKFLWQCSEQQLINHYLFYLELVEHGLDLPQEHITIILEPGVFFEELAKKPLASNLKVWRGLDPEYSVALISEYLAEKYYIKPKLAIEGLLPPDILMNKKYLTENQFKILLVYILRHNFIPANFSRTPQKILVRTGDTWQEFDFINNQYEVSTESSKELISLRISFLDEYEQPLKLDSSQFTFTVFNNGRFYPVPVETEYEDFTLNALLNEGVFYLHTGYRLSDKETRYYLTSLNTKTKELLDITLYLDDYPLSWDEIPPELSFLKKITESIVPKPQMDTIFIFGDYSREMIQRLATRVRSVITNQDFYWVGENSHVDSPPEYLIKHNYAEATREYPDLKNLIITLYYCTTEGKWQYYQGIWDNLPGKGF